jgi:ketosteroid isomerase-like protein
MATNDVTADERRRTALEVQERHLALMLDKDMTGWVDLWADDGIFEFPFAPPGFPTRLEGKEAIREYIKDYPKHIDLAAFHDVQVHPTLDPDVLVVEMRAEGRIVATGKPYDMSYIAVITVRDGKLAGYRDYWNPLKALEALGGAEALTAAFAGS